jgi:hypothetical protein
MPIITRPLVRTALPEEIVDALAAHCEGERPGTSRTARLAEDVLSVLYAVGMARDGRDASRLWHELEAPEPDHHGLARAFGRMAKTPNPLDPGVCSGQARQELVRLIRLRWNRWWSPEGRFQPPPRVDPDWGALSAKQRDAVREMVRHLEVWHRRQVRFGRPRKGELDTALHQLAEVYAHHSGFDLHVYELPHRESSPFILFAAKALDGCYDPTEISPRALSKRWKRAKEWAAKDEPVVPATIRTKKPKRPRLQKYDERPKSLPMPGTSPRAI